MGARNSAVDKAVDLIRKGIATGPTDAAKRVDNQCSPQAVRDRWLREEGERPYPAREVVEVEADESERPEEATPREKELARQLREARTRSEAKTVELREARAAVSEVEKRVEELEAVVELAHAVENVDRPDWLHFKPKRGEHRGTLMPIFSDYHLGEHVNPAEMSWYNAYSTDIAELRIKRFFEKIIVVARNHLAGVKYDGIVIPSLGDTVSGGIHEELRETDELSVFDSVVFAQPLIAEGLEMLEKEFGLVHVESVPGNHPRDSRKPRHKQRSAHNADSMLWKLVANSFKDNDHITINVPESFDTNFAIYETRFRAEHGDQARGGGGIQGAMLPLAMRTHKIRKQAQAEGNPFDIVLYGHWHQLMSLPAKGFIVNGSGKGYDEYARTNAFDPEAPQQALCLVTPEHGISAELPLYVSKREEEGW